LPRLAAGQASRAAPKLVLIAGGPSHGYMTHEHYAGFVLIRKWLEAAGLGLQTVVCKGGWPQDESVFDGATAIAVNSDGEGRHPLNGRLEKLDGLRQRGVGLALIHFALILNKRYRVAPADARRAQAEPGRAGSARLRFRPASVRSWPVERVRPRHPPTAS
jgi:hypothetical protein